jgi:hypothetical protein
VVVILLTLRISGIEIEFENVNISGDACTLGDRNERPRLERSAMAARGEAWME